MKVPSSLSIIKPRIKKSTNEASGSNAMVHADPLGLTFSH